MSGRDIDRGCQILFCSIVMLCLLSVPIGLIVGGKVVHQNYVEDLDVYQVCFREMNCTKECSLRGCRTSGCDLFYCPAEPHDLSETCYIMSGISVFLIITMIGLACTKP